MLRRMLCTTISLIFLQGDLLNQYCSGPQSVAAVILPGLPPSDAHQFPTSSNCYAYACMGRLIMTPSTITPMYLVIFRHEPDREHTGYFLYIHGGSADPDIR